MPIPLTGYAHVRLTVRDIDRSREFYESLFGLPVAYEVPEDADETTRNALAFLYHGVIYQVGDGLLGLRPVAPESDRFDEDRVGLDHVSFTVPARADLDRALEALEARGVPHSGIKHVGAGFILEFRDPDNIALELSAPAD